MAVPRILVVDDEKNIRLTVPQALATLDLPVETAVNGEEALAKMAEKPYDVVLLDLKMPGMDGMDVLRVVAHEHPRSRVVIITAHGSVPSAVEAMKLGAIDYVQKPFSPTELRSVVTRVLAREDLDEQTATSYPALVEFAKRHIADRAFDQAEEAVRRAMATDPTHPEAFNLLGALFEIRGDWLEAMRLYRAALDLDPTYKPASVNVERVALHHRAGAIDLGASDAATDGGRPGRGRHDRDDR
jgi:DNA-binding response OmpR family regulator